MLAIETAGGQNNQLSETALTLLLDLIHNGGESKAVSQAVQLIASANLSKTQLLKLAPVLKHAGPVEICSSIPPFARIREPAVAIAFLVEAMENSR